MKILITGFDPFGGENINPALEAVKKLPDTILGQEVIKIEIPTVFRKSLEKIEENIQKHNPDVVISVGQAGGRFGVTPERVAINIDDARIKDNEGNQPIDISIYEDGETAYCLGMAIFTAIMGNAFAAFSVITVGIGVPFVFAQGGDPIVASALAMTAGFCGTLLTPMAANFNILPVALLETKDKNAVIKVQAVFALILLAIHIPLMYFLAF